MMKRILGAALILANAFASTSFAQETGPADTVYRVPAAGGRAVFGSTLRKIKVSGLSVAVVSKTAGYTAANVDDVIQVNATGGAVTIDLPSIAGGVLGKVYIIKKTDGSANAVTIDGNASETIDGNTTYALGGQYDWVEIRNSGTEWIVTSKSSAGAPTGTAYSVATYGSGGSLTGLGPLTNGQVLVGSTGGASAPATLTGTANRVSVTNGSNSITLSTPQDIAASSSPTFVSPLLTGSVLLEDPGAGTNTITMRAPTLGASWSFTLPTTDGNSGECLTTDGSGVTTWAACGGGGGGVTSVGLTVPATSIFSVSNSPITSSGNISLLTAGTSGGIPYFSSTSQIASSGLLGANAILLGGGAGTAPSSLGSTGTTTTLLHGNAAGAPSFGAVVTADVTDANITNAKLADMAQSTIKGRAAGAGTGVPTDLSATQATAIINTMVGDSGSGGTKGLVPAPATGDATKCLTGAGLWSTCGGGGGSGTVTSVGLTVPGTSIFGVTGSPVTTSGSLGLTTTGTSGGIPYFNSSSTLSSSTALTSGQVVVGGGAGSAPSVVAAGTAGQVLVSNGASSPSWNDGPTSVAQASFYGSAVWPGTASCDWAVTSSTFVDFSANASCPTPTVVGGVSAPGTKVPHVVLNSLTAANYMFVGSFPHFNSTAGSSDSCRLVDDLGTVVDMAVGATGNSSDVKSTILIGTIPYLSPQASRTVKLQCRSTGGTVDIDLSSAATYRQAKVEVFKYPLQSQIVQPDNVNYEWTPYTPVFTGWGTVTGVSAWHKRVGGNLLLKWVVTSGTTTATEARMSLPSGLTSAGSSTIATLEKCGEGAKASNGADTIHVLIEPSVAYVTFGVGYASGSGFSKQTGSSAFGSATAHSFTASLPIAGWLPSQTYLIPAAVPTLFGTKASPRVIVAATGITTGAAHMSATATRQKIYVAGSTTGDNVAATVSACTVDGQEMILVGTLDNQPVILNSTTTNVKSNGPVWLGLNDSAFLSCDGTDWVVMDRRF